MKAILDAAGLQCSEIECDTSKQVFTGLQLNHENRILSLEASRIWKLRLGLELAARQRHLAGDQVAKLIGHNTWSCQRFAHTFGPLAGGYGPRSPRNFDGLRHHCRFSTAILPALGLCGYMLRMPRVGHVGATELRVAGVILRMLRRQAAVRSGGGFRRNNLSALVDQCWLKVGGESTQKPPGLDSKKCTKKIVLTCIRPLWEARKRVFSQCLLIALPSKMCHPPNFSPSLPGTSCVKVSGGTIGDVAGRGQSSCHGVASCVSVY